MPSTKAFGTGAVVLMINVSPENFCTTARASGNLRCNIRTQYRHPSYQPIRIDFGWNRQKFVFRPRLRSPFNAAARYAFNRKRRERLRRYGDRAINSLVGGLEIAQGHVTVSQVNQDAFVFRIERSRFFQIRS